MFTRFLTTAMFDLMSVSLTGRFNCFPIGRPPMSICQKKDFELTGQLELPQRFPDAYFFQTFGQHIFMRRFMRSESMSNFTTRLNQVVALLCEVPDPSDPMVHHLSGFQSTKEDGNLVWINLKYERVPDFCYRGGKLGHLIRVSNEEVPEANHENLKFIMWLRTIAPQGQLSGASRKEEIKATRQSRPPNNGVPKRNDKENVYGASQR
ncbi:conserved hypothetical protein [Ricinus communis]|uniref:Uncharacterized protein n=1 Tax=Ricinus communis TaxID=3988 RepID=B9SDZ3_RICCO|nr:conserved hypothetical protein [Ricinus communis]